MKKAVGISFFVAALLSCSPHIAQATQPSAATLATYGLHYGTVNHLSSISTLDQAIASGAQVVVKFGASWCGPCRQMAPVISQVASELTSVIFIDVNFDSFKELAQRYGIKSIPAILLFKNGSEVARTIGFKDKSSLTNLIKNSFGL